MREFVIVNQSKRVTAKECRAMAAAVAKQVKRDFAPAWGMLAVPVRVAHAVPVGAFPIYIQDTPDEDGALGYHTEEGDQEYARIFVDPVLDNGGVVLFDPKDYQRSSVASVLSHEVLELLADPFVNSWVEGTRTKHGNLYSLEVCDPVEAEQYAIDSVAVSNFVLPEWFNTDVTRTDKYDFLGSLTAPFTMSKGATDPQEVFAKNRAKWRTAMKQAHTGSRTNRRTNRI